MCPFPQHCEHQHDNWQLPNSSLEYKIQNSNGLEHVEWQGIANRFINQNKTFQINLNFKWGLWKSEWEKNNSDFCGKRIKRRGYLIFSFSFSVSASWQITFLPSMSDFRANIRNNPPFGGGDAHQYDAGYCSVYCCCHNNNWYHPKSADFWAIRNPNSVNLRSWQYIPQHAHQNSQKSLSLKVNPSDSFSNDPSILEFHEKQFSTEP